MPNLSDHMDIHLGTPVPDRDKPEVPKTVTAYNDLQHYNPSEMTIYNS